MDEILYLEPDEEITSVIDKLKGLPGQTVALVLPKRSALAASVVNLKLLKREAGRLKKSISLVTSDKVGTSLAGQIGIPVYKAIGDDTPVPVSKSPIPKADEVIELDAKDEAPEKSEANEEDDVVDDGIPVHHYGASVGPPAHAADQLPGDQSDLSDLGHSPQVTNSPSHQLTPAQTHQASNAMPQRSSTPQSSSYAIRRGPVLTLLALLLVAFLGWFFFVYPQATVVLSVISEPVNEKVTITVDNNLTEVNNDEGRIPGQKVQVETTVKQTIPATGEKEVGEKAKGTIIINNRLGETISLPKGSTLSRDGRDFTTTEAAEISAATVSLDSSGNVLVKPGTKSVAVEATALGSAGNLAPGDFVITSFTGTKRDRVTGSNAATFAGGESRMVKVVTEDDLVKAREDIGKGTNEQLVTELKEKAKDLTVLANTIQVDVIDISANKAAGDEADAFDVEAKVRARTIGFAASDYQAMVVERISATLPEGKELVVTNDDSVETSVKATNYDQGTLELDATLRTEMVQTLDEQSLRNLIRGKTALSAEEALKTQEGIQNASISLRPSLKSKVPNSDSQIIIQLDRQGEQSQPSLKPQAEEEPSDPADKPVEGAGAPSDEPTDE